MIKAGEAVATQESSATKRPASRDGVVIMEANLDEVNKENPKHEGAKRRKGFLTFCGHGDILSFKGMRIKELPETK